MPQNRFFVSFLHPFHSKIRNFFGFASSNLPTGNFLKFVRTSEPKPCRGFHLYPFQTRGSCGFVGFVRIHGVLAGSRGSFAYTGFLRVRGVRSHTRGSCGFVGFVLKRGVLAGSWGSFTSVGFLRVRRVRSQPRGFLRFPDYAICSVRGRGFPGASRNSEPTVGDSTERVTSESRRRSRQPEPMRGRGRHASPFAAPCFPNHPFLAQSTRHHAHRRKCEKNKNLK